MNFRLPAQMYVVAPKVQLAHYVDNTMPKRDWSEYDSPACERRPVSRLAQQPISQRSFAQAG